jgi:acyl carrier protein
MGLATVELVMEVEAAFGITLPDEDAQHVVTVGDLHALVVRLMDERDGATRREGACPSAAAFYALRRGAMAALTVDRAAIRPAAPASLLAGPYRGRLERWSLLESASGLRLPPLRLPNGIFCFIVALSLASGLVAGRAAYRASGDFGGAFVACVLVPLPVLLALTLLASPLARSVPDDCETLRGLTRAVAARNLGTLAARGGRRPTGDETFAALRAIIVETLGVAPEAVTPAARIIEDLGAG